MAKRHYMGRRRCNASLYGASWLFMVLDTAVAANPSGWRA